MLPVLLYYCSSGWIPKPKDELQLTKEMLRLLWFCKTFRPFSSTKEMLQCCTCSKQIRCYHASNKMESCYLFGSALCCPHCQLLFMCALKMEDNNSYSGKHTRIKNNSCMNGKFLHCSTCCIAAHVLLSTAASDTSTYKQE